MSLRCGTSYRCFYYRRVRLSQPPHRPGEPSQAGDSFDLKSPTFEYCNRRGIAVDETLVKVVVVGPFRKGEHWILLLTTRAPGGTSRTSRSQPREWVFWFNSDRIHGSLDDVTPIEVEQIDYAHHQPLENSGLTPESSSPGIPGAIHATTAATHQERRRVALTVQSRPRVIAPKRGSKKFAKGRARLARTREHLHTANRNEFAHVIGTPIVRVLDPSPNRTTTIQVGLNMRREPANNIGQQQVRQHLAFQVPEVLLEQRSKLTKFVYERSHDRYGARTHCAPFQCALQLVGQALNDKAIRVCRVKRLTTDLRGLFLLQVDTQTRSGARS